jgi:hypothetical protein
MCKPCLRLCLKKLPNRCSLKSIQMRATYELIETTATTSKGCLTQSEVRFSMTYLILIDIKS